MPTQNHAPCVASGDRCIIHVPEHASPKGWWWGTVQSVERAGETTTYYEVKAVITGTFGFAPSTHHAQVPAFGSAELAPTSDYRIYPFSPETIQLVRIIRTQEDGLEAQLRKISELREFVRLLGTDPEFIKKTLREAIKDANTR